MKRILFISCILISFSSCKRSMPAFVQITPDHSNIHFNNTIIQNDSVNVFDFPNIFNGGGVGIGDFNNDGLEDIYFTGNLVPNAMYLNEGKMVFRDITKTSGTDGGGIWSRGVAVVDINNDGRLDLYVCATAKPDPKDRVNLLYVNQGNDQQNTCIFKEMAAEYGLNDTTQSTMANFFDYDNDGDLDLYIGVNHIIIDEYANTFRKRNLNGEHPSTGKLYRNDWKEELKHGVFSDVSREAGILIEGYTHAVNVTDFNDDGWQDIMVANDYASNNVLYINNRNGTFTDRTMDYFKHTAFNSMGSDAVDINNDGLTDIIEVDMMPQDNFRKKMFQSPSSYQTYHNIEQFDYQYQYPRNMIHLNMGPSLGEKDSIQHPVFGDVGYFSNLAETDWSWCPLVADFDQDGNKDIIFTNGFPKDITDHDYMTYRKEAMRLTSKKEMLEAIPEVKIHNYAFRNQGDLRFSDVSYSWGLGTTNFSNGAAYADLDNDGDLDMIINNINDPAGIYENRLNEKEKDSAGRFISLRLTGSPQNKNAIGARAVFYHNGSQQVYDNTPYRGYLSTQSMTINAGFGNFLKIDSIVVSWPDSRRMVMKDVSTNQQLIAEYEKAAVVPQEKKPDTYLQSLFANITASSGVNLVHHQRDFIDFGIQKQLPHKFSEYSPGIATADINGDGLDDFITGASPGNIPTIFQQQPDGRFSGRALYKSETAGWKKTDDRGLLLFDAEGDGDADLFISGGGYSYTAGDSAYSDHFYVNDGKGNFSESVSSIPFNTTSKLCARAADYDRDGDLDLFISGRVEPWTYPKPVSSFIYRNDSRKGETKFTDVTTSVAPSLINAGMICDGLFTDFDNDGWMDLLLAGEWMPIVFLRNENGIYKDVTSKTGIGNQKGWWTSIVAADFDNDGDMDYIAGNLGLNSFYKASDERPVSIRAKDFDNNGSFDAIPSLYLPADLSEKTIWAEYPAYGRDDMIKQMISTRIKYQNYSQFAKATIDSILTKEKMTDAIHLSVNHLASSFIRNEGNGKFSLQPLPWQAQLAPLDGMVCGDFNQDGFTDVMISANDFGTEPVMGRYDAMNGLLLIGDGNGNFRPASYLESGIFIGGDARGLARLRDNRNGYLIVATQNRGPVLVFQSKKTFRQLTAPPGAMAALFHLKNGKTQKVETSYGSSFLSQSTRSFEVPMNAESCDIIFSDGKTSQVHL